MHQTMAVLSLAAGATGWLMLAPLPLGWIGLGADLAALVLAWLVLRSSTSPRSARRWAICGLLSAAAAALVCIALLKTISVDLW